MANLTTSHFKTLINGTVLKDKSSLNNLDALFIINVGLFIWSLT